MSENPHANPNNNDGLAQPIPATRLEGSQQVIQQLLAALPEMFPGVQPIPLKNISPNPDNPGAAITEEQIKELGENIQARGLLNAIRVNPNRANPFAGGAQPHPDNFRVKADSQPWELGDFNFIVLTGENRYRAALWLKWETIPGHILNPTAKEAVILNHLDNDVRDRGWWASYQSIENLIKADPNMTQREIKTELKLPLSQVNRAFGLLPLLNPEARALIVPDGNNSNKGKKGISERAAARLSDLGPGTGLKPGVKKKDPTEAPSGVLYPYPAIPPETQNLVYRTLVVACAHQMTEKQVAKLVEWVQAGNPPETFGAAPKTPKTKKAVGISPEAADKLLGFGKELGAAETRGEDTAPIQEQLKAFRESLASPKTGISPTAPSPAPAAPSADEEPGWFWKWMLGFKFIQEMRTKAKTAHTKGNNGPLAQPNLAPRLAGSEQVPLTRWEKILVLGYGSYKKTEPARKGLKHLLGKKHYNWLKAALFVVIFCALYWAAGKLYQFVWLNPLRWIESKVVSGFHWGGHSNEQPTPLPLSPSVASAPMPIKETTALPKKIEKPKPVVVYQPAVSFNTSASSSASAPVMTLYDPKILELEIKSLPRNCFVKDYPLTPDEGIPGDVAVSRMQDITDRDKYTLMIGSDKLIVLSVNPTNTTLTINYKSTDLFNVLGGGDGPIHFLWEDVKYIHANEIDIETKNPSVIYQCSLVVSGSKYPLTLQCASAADLEHLVSTMQYFIRASRLAHDTALAGMPYPTQGLWLNNDRVVEKLWANSPADHGGLRLGDHLWSVGKPTSDQQSKKELEAELQSSPVTAFTASPAEWDKAAIAARQSSMSNPIHPRLRKVVISL